MRSTTDRGSNFGRRRHVFYVWYVVPPIIKCTYFAIPRSHCVLVSIISVCLERVSGTPRIFTFLGNGLRCTFRQTCPLSSSSTSYLFVPLRQECKWNCDRSLGSVLQELRLAINLEITRVSSKTKQLLVSEWKRRKSLERTYTVGRDTLGPLLRTLPFRSWLKPDGKVVKKIKS